MISFVQIQIPSLTFLFYALRIYVNCLQWTIVFQDSATIGETAQPGNGLTRIDVSECGNREMQGEEDTQVL
jgi:hypothetical protein